MSIDFKQDESLGANAISIRNRQPKLGGIAHADQGTQFTLSLGE